MKRKDLQKEIQQLSKKLLRLRNKEEKMELQSQLPALKEKYEGKYWKYRNGNGTEEWWLYSYCERVTGINTALAHSFESQDFGIHQFRIYDAYFHNFEYEISRREFLEALRTFKEQLSKVGIPGSGK